MKTMAWKKAVSLLLCIVMTVSMFPLSAWAEENTENAEVETDGLEIEGTNSVGGLLTNTIYAHQESLSEECYVTDIQISETTAIVAYQTICDADVVVAVYDETSLQMLGSGVASVTADTSSTDVVLDMDELPEYFVVSAYLLEAGTHQPLCEHFVSQYYTEEFQALLNSTAADYDPERVLLLSEDETTNFLVFGEKTLLAEESTEKNIITDNGDGTYTITNADDGFQNLQIGDTFSYAYEDGTVLIVVAAAVEVDGTTVTVTEKADAELSEVFDYVKIETDSYQGESYVDTSEADEGVTYEGPAPQTYAVDIETSYSTSEVYSINKKFDEDTKISGSVKFSFTVKLEAYISLGYQYVSLKTEYSVAAEAELSGKLINKELAMGKITFIPVPGVNISFKVALVFEASASITWTLEYKGCIGFAYDSDTGFKNLCKAPSTSSSIEVEGKIFFGLKLELALSLVSEKLSEVSGSAQAGIEASATKTLWESNSSNQHDCSNCLEGELYVKLSFKVSLELLDGVVEAEKTLASFKSKLSDYYMSLTYGEFGWGTCPHIRYKVDVIAWSEDGTPLVGATVNGTGFETAPVTDESGKAVFYLKNGTYTLSVSDDTYEIEKTITVHNGSKSLILCASAIEFSSGSVGNNLNWTLYSNGILVISGTGAMRDYNPSSTTHKIAPWGDYKDTIKAVVITDGVTSIGTYAFYECSSLTSVTIPDGVTSIGKFAFDSCSNLTSVIIPDGVTNIGMCTFQNCSSLTSITIPDSVTSIGASAFESCHDLTSITIPDSVTSIGFYAFEGCSSLTSITIPAGVTSIGGKAFADCSSLTSFNIPDGIVTIEPFTFERCESLADIKIPDSVTAIGRYAFYYCESLTSITLPENLTYIGESAFRRCDKLASITIPDSVTTISDLAFQNLQGLTSLTLGDGVTSIGERAFDTCQYLTSITFGSSVPTIDSSAFYYCTSLTDIYLSDISAWLETTSINDVCLQSESFNYINMYLDGNLITDLVIPDGTTNIGMYAFYKCKNLTSVTIPDSITKIRGGAFDGCYGLADVYYDGTEDQWAEISIYSSSFPSPPPVIHYKISEHASGTCGENLTWSVSEAGVFTISGIGEMYDYAALTAPWYNLDTRAITSVVINPGVTSVGQHAFELLPALEQVVIPKSVESIGMGAFICNQQLKTVNYEGAESDWAAIEIGNNNDALDNADINYNYEISTLTPWQGTCGEKLTWKVSVAGELTISGTGEMYNYGFDYETDEWRNTPWYKYDDSITSVVIEEGVTSIGNYAFYELKNLESIHIPSTVTSIAFDAMDYCSSLSGIWVDEDNEVFASSEDGVLFSKDMKTLIRCPGGKAGVYEIPESVTSVGYYAFFACFNVIPSLPENLETIADGAFNLCKSIQSIEIPASVTSIGSAAFMECYDLESITVAADNENYASVEGVLYSKDGTILVAVPTAKSGSFVIPDGVTTIKSFAFAANEINSLTIPTSVTAIYEGALMLRSYTTGETWLKNVYYLGSEDQWAAIDIGFSNNFILDAATIHYNSTNPMMEEDAANVSMLPTTDGLVYEPSEIVAATPNDIPETTEMPVQTESPTETESSTNTQQPAATEVPAQTEAPVVTEEPVTTDNPELTVTPDSTETPAPTETPITTEIPGEAETPTDIIVPEEPVIELLAAYSGTAEDSDGQKLVSFSGLVAGERYALLVTTVSVKGSDLSPDTLLYISQTTADSNGSLGFSYIPKEDVDGAVVMAYGLSNKSLEDAAITVTTNTSGTSSLQVSYDGTALTEDTDYVLYAEDNADGTCTVTVKGVDDYAGTATAQLYGVFYDANGGAGAPLGQAQIVGTSLTLSNVKPTRPGYVFLGWATDKAATEAEYASGAPFEENTTTVLYALWEKTYLLGDVNEDGEVTIADAVRIARYDAGYVELTESQMAAADTNGDGEVTIADAVRIARYDAGYIDEL